MPSTRTWCASTFDGATAMPLLAAAENWPETPWMKPWSPADAAS